MSRKTEKAASISCLTDAAAWTLTPSPIGDILIVGDDEAVTALHFLTDQEKEALEILGTPRKNPLLAEAVSQLEAYFSGRTQAFSLPLNPQGTAFQKQVWKALQTIPFGTTTSYGALAQSLANPKAVRAVGAANGANPIGIVIPCHRVIGSNGTLTGYAGGLHRKKYLLELEGVLPQEVVQGELF